MFFRKQSENGASAMMKLVSRVQILIRMSIQIYSLQKAKYPTAMKKMYRIRALQITRDDRLSIR